MMHTSISSNTQQPPNINTTANPPSFHPTSVSQATIEEFKTLLENDVRIKVAGIDLDGILRGKIMAKTKFLSILESGFGFCSIVFGWDMHDKPYEEELSVSNAANGNFSIFFVMSLCVLHAKGIWYNRTKVKNMLFILTSARLPMKITRLQGHGCDPRLVDVQTNPMGE